MNCDEKNSLLITGPVDREDLWPKINEYEAQRFQFRWEFGLTDLPTTGGVISIRGARQIGKSTWLELKLLETIEKYGLGTAFILNGDSIYSHDEFEKKLLELSASFKKNAKVRRIFIDEITQIKNWERVIKRLIDQGQLKNILIVTTGSNAADLKHGQEKLPGRKGDLDRTEYIFLPISFKEFYYQTKGEIGQFESDLLPSYILTGGSPLAIQSLYLHEYISDSFTSLICDWILGDVVESGRSRIFLLNLLKRVYATAPSSLSYTKLAKEAGLANNSAALDYVERLSDLLILQPMMLWDHNKNTSLARSASKFNFINLSAAWAFHPKCPRYIHEVKKLEGRERGAMFEWLVAQELWRQTVLARQSETSRARSPHLELDLMYWASQTHEIDFVLPDRTLIEVKAGPSDPKEFAWFSKVFPNKSLKIISDSEFETDHVKSIKPITFLLEAPSDLYFDSDRVPWPQL